MNLRASDVGETGDGSGIEVGEANAGNGGYFWSLSSIDTLLWLFEYLYP